MYKVLSIKYLKKIFFLFILATCYLLLATAPTAQAQTMSNKDYKIKMEGLNTISGAVTKEDQSTLPPVGARGVAISEGVNFKVRTGFENTASVLPFSVTLSSDLTDFGALNPTNPIIRTVDLNVYSLSVYGYSVLASEDHSLKMSSDASETNIPNTTCDNGQCNEKNAEEWTNTLTYGFGYRCDNMTGFDCDSSFSKLNFYKHFADTSSSQLPQSVMAGIGSKNKNIRLSYKVNISGTQAEGIYNNVVTFIAVPNF